MVQIILPNVLSFLGGDGDELVNEILEGNDNSDDDNSRDNDDSDNDDDESEEDNDDSGEDGDDSIEDNDDHDNDDNSGDDSDYWGVASKLIFSTIFLGEFFAKLVVMDRLF